MEALKPSFQGLGLCTGTELASCLCGVMQNQPLPGGYISEGSLVFIFGGFFSCIYWTEEMVKTLGWIADLPDTEGNFSTWKDVQYVLPNEISSSQNSRVQ